MSGLIQKHFLEKIGHCFFSSPARQKSFLRFLLWHILTSADGGCTCQSKKCSHSVINCSGMYIIATCQCHADYQCVTLSEVVMEFGLKVTVCNQGMQGREHSQSPDKGLLRKQPVYQPSRIGLENVVEIFRRCRGQAR